MAAIAVAVVVIVMSRFLSRGCKTTGKTAPVTSLKKEWLQKGREDTLLTQRSFSGEKTLSRKTTAVHHPAIEYLAEGNLPYDSIRNVARLCPESSDSLTEYSAVIADSGFVMRLDFVTRGDSLPPIVRYQGVVEIPIIHRTDTLHCDSEKTIQISQPWYNTFYAGAAAVVVAIAVLLVAVK
jgi:hypothetical protein